MSRIWTSQPQIPVGLSRKSTFTLLPSVGDRNLANNVSPSTVGGAYGVNGKGKFLRTQSSYPKYSANPLYQSAQRTALVLFSPNEGLPATASKRILSDFDGSTYSFVLSFETTSISLYCHNGTTAGSALWTTTPSIGVPICLVGVFNGTNCILYADGKQVASGSLSGSLRSVANGLAIGGNPSGGSEALDLNCYLAWSTDKALSPQEIKSLSDNPWQLIQPLPSRIFVGPAAAVTNPSGDLAATEGSTDTSAFTGIVLVQGTAAATESGSDTFAATGGGVTTTTGTLAATETGDDTAASTGTVLVQGALAATDADSDTATSTGTVLVQGSAAATDSGTDTFAATGGSITATTGTLDATEAGSDSATSSGTILVQGLLAALEAGGDTVYIDGQIYIVGACAATETGSDTFAASSAAVVIPGALVGGLRDSKTQTSLRAGRIQTGTRNAKIQLGRR